MRSLSDICISDDVQAFLRGRGWGIIHARDVGLNGQPDENIWGFARRESRVLITFDFDFRRFHRFPLNNHPGCIVIDTSRGRRMGEVPDDLVIRTLARALPLLPARAEMRETRVYLEANRGMQVSQDGEERELYRDA